MRINKNVEFVFDLKDLAMVLGFAFALGGLWSVLNQRVSALELKAKEQAPVSVKLAELTGLVLGVKAEQISMHRDINTLQASLLGDNRAALRR